MTFEDVGNVEMRGLTARHSTTLFLKLLNGILIDVAAM